MKGTRVFQVAALLLVLVSLVQVGWWVFDRYTDANEKVRQLGVLHAQQLAAGRAMQDAGIPAERIVALLPQLQVKGDQVLLEPAVIERLDEERRAKLHQYLWEGGFFLLALGVCVGVISMALRAEARIVREQDSFLALVSHQFKTPLASLQLSLETMAIRPLSPEQSRTLIDRMLADLSRMVAMVSQILDSVRLERGQANLKREPVELAGAATRVVGQLEERARNDRIAVTVDIPRRLEVLDDPLSVDVVIRNLVENALASVAAAGGGTLSLAARRSNGEIELVVKDSGVGFKPSDQALLFKKFSRLHPGGGSRDYGTGLGLYIVQRLMQLAGGRVVAKSDGVGRGAAFVLTWPAASAEAP